MSISQGTGRGEFINDTYFLLLNILIYCLVIYSGWTFTAHTHLIYRNA